MIIAVDPGKVTGIATWSDGIFVSWQEKCWPAIDRIWNTLDGGIAVEAVVCESYAITASTLRKTRQPHSLESIGALRWMCLRHDIPFQLQSPADAKRFADDRKLKRLSWYQPTTDGHANDAARHLLTYLANHRQEEFRGILGDLT